MANPQLPSGDNAARKLEEDMSTYLNHRLQPMNEQIANLTNQIENLTNLLAAQQRRADDTMPTNQSPTPQPGPPNRLRKPLPLPDKFSGKRSDFPGWLQQMRDKLELNADLLQGSREAWYLIYSCLGDYPKKTVATFYETMKDKDNYNIFLDYLHKNYGNHDTRRDATISLRNLKQAEGQKFATFLPQFEKVLAEAGGIYWQDHMKISQLEGALNKSLSRALITAILPEDYLGWQQQVSIIARNQERFDNTYGAEDSTRRTPRGRSQFAARELADLPIAGARQPDGDVVMGGVSKLSPYQGTKKSRLATAKKRGRCYRCDLPGHHIRNCPDRARKPNEDSRHIARIEGAVSSEELDSDEQSDSSKD